MLLTLKGRSLSTLNLKTQYLRHRKYCCFYKSVILRNAYLFHKVKRKDSYSLQWHVLSFTQYRSGVRRYIKYFNGTTDYMVNAWNESTDILLPKCKIRYLAKYVVISRSNGKFVTKEHWKVWLDVPFPAESINVYSFIKLPEEICDIDTPRNESAHKISPLFLDIFQLS
jgi:hypothetical protein